MKLNVSVNRIKERERKFIPPLAKKGTITVGPTKD